MTLRTNIHPDDRQDDHHEQHNEVNAAVLALQAGAVPGVGLGVSSELFVALDGSQTFLSFPDPAQEPRSGTEQTTQGYVAWDESTSTLTVLAAGLYSVGFEVDVETIDGSGSGSWGAGVAIEGGAWPGHEGADSDVFSWGAVALSKTDVTTETSIANEFVRAFAAGTTLRLYVSEGSGATVVYGDLNIWRLA